MKIIRGIFLAVFATLSFAAHSGAGWTFNHFGVKPYSGYAAWQSETTITAGPQTGQKISQKTCASQADALGGAAKMQAVGDAMTHCKTTIIQDTASYAEGVQACNFDVGKTETVLKMTKLSDTSYQTDSAITTTSASSPGAFVTATRTISQYLGPCTPEPAPPRASGDSAECKTSKKNVEEMRAQCKTGQLPAQLCGGTLKQMEAISAMACGG